jgi:hypothetical protein
MQTYKPQFSPCNFRAFLFGKKSNLCNHPCSKRDTSPEVEFFQQCRQVFASIRGKRPVFRALRDMCLCCRLNVRSELGREFAPALCHHVLDPSLNRRVIRKRFDPVLLSQSSSLVHDLGQIVLQLRPDLGEVESMLHRASDLLSDSTLHREQKGG